MSDKQHVRIVEGYRSANENEFFFANDPRRTLGYRDLFDYLEEHGIIFEEIPSWQLKSVVKSAHNFGYERVEHGVRVIIKK